MGKGKKAKDAARDKGKAEVKEAARTDEASDSPRARAQRDAVIERTRKFVGRYEVTRAKGFRLADCDPADLPGRMSDYKDEAKAMLAQGVSWLARLQDKLYAQDRRSLLLVFQAMDAAGKDGTIKHVMSGVNPQGVQVSSFKQPSAEELDHDYLWRYWRALPERGRIGIFNRSYYEEVLVVRVHQSILASQKLPPEAVRKDIFKRRLEDIAHFEDYLSRNGTRVLKFFLNVSPDEQKKRFMERLDNPDKNWKFSSADIRERGHWADYMAAYEDAIRATATTDSPWYVVPADNKWVTRLVVVGAIGLALEGMKLHYPVIDDAKRAELAQARSLLTGDA
ncbi:MAG: polyphosphate kinase 2 family protein [Burkholderiaceae bacterium]|jgi:PPK2 family polyphosphate:nucleotide phosphotransferase|nr:polyphosphate kinase 2 family protein [Burkholderiaceae bacterium]